VKAWIRNLDKDAREMIEQRDFPQWTEPMLATLTHDYFSDEDWIYERKLDGERCLAFIHEGELRLRSRNRKELNETYPELAEALLSLRRESLVADGEVVAFKNNVTSFSRLQGRMQVQSAEEARRSGIKVYYYLFDLFYLDGFDVGGLPLRRRKTLLKAALPFSDPVRYLNHRNASGLAYLREACRKGWEGLIAKEAGCAYVHGRSEKWLKFKCSMRQEFVIGGFTEPEGERSGFGALLIGYYDDQGLRYAGKVGTGFDRGTLEDLRSRFESIERERSPFVDEGIEDAKVHWVAPELVGEVAFTEWTSGGKLRHPSFVGLRRDKAARDVQREG
jgi:bifunctional non-homologous end joining protein LigD